MGNRPAASIEAHEMVPMSDSHQAQTPLVLSETDQSDLPRTTPVPLLHSSIHLLPESFAVLPDGSFVFTFDALFASQLQIVQRHASLPQGKTESFSVASGLGQEFKGWALNAGEGEVEIRIECEQPTRHEEITSVRVRVREEMAARVVAQSIRLQGREYELHELYGVPEEEEKGECAVCLFNPKDTVVIPCYHMCLCASCGNMLRVQLSKKCPICRCGNIYTEAESLLKVTC
jgi:hypothetical protein